MFIRRVALCLLMFCALRVEAMAANYPIIVQVKPLANINLISSMLGGRILDSIPGANIHLLSVPVLPSLLPSLQLKLLGLVTIEFDKTIVAPSMQRTAVMTVGASAADWYKAQPEMMRIRSNQAQAYSRGAGIVVADINSRVDFGHPALAGHLTGGYDFVGARADYSSTLNQSSATFLDQSNATFLDQSSATFLDQSSATFLDQSAATFLDQSAATFLDHNMVTVLDGGNPAYSHGTLCAGIIAAVAPDSRIMPLRVFDDSGNADVFSISKAIYHAVNNGARVINLSFGMAQTSGSVQNALAYAADSNVQVVASAGNANTATPQFPASVSTVMSVASTDRNEMKASFSNYGSSVYVTAPGVNIISAYPGGYYAMVSGTSFSAPMVAGEAALIMSAKPATNAKTVIGSAVVSIYNQNPSYVGKLGRGRIDVLSAVQQ